MQYVHGLVLDVLDATWIAMGFGFGVLATLAVQHLGRKFRG